MVVSALTREMVSPVNAEPPLITRCKSAMRIRARTIPPGALAECAPCVRPCDGMGAIARRAKIANRRDHVPIRDGTGNLPLACRLRVDFARRLRRWPCSFITQTSGPGMRPTVETFMFGTKRIRTLALAAALALLSPAAVAQSQCLITGNSSLCNGPVQLCGPDGLYEYTWIDPSGQFSFDRCTIACARP